MRLFVSVCVSLMFVATACATPDRPEDWAAAEHANTSVDPFDPSSCAGPELTSTEIEPMLNEQALFSERRIGNIALSARWRECTDGGECGAWSAPWAARRAKTGADYEGEVRVGRYIRGKNDRLVGTSIRFGQCGGISTCVDGRCQGALSPTGYERIWREHYPKNEIWYCDWEREEHQTLETATTSLTVKASCMRYTATVVKTDERYPGLRWETEYAGVTAR